MGGKIKSKNAAMIRKGMTGLEILRNNCIIFFFPH